MPAGGAGKLPQLQMERLLNVCVDIPDALWFSVSTVKFTFVPAYVEMLTPIVSIHAGVRR